MMSYFQTSHSRVPSLSIPPSAAIRRTAKFRDRQQSEGDPTYRIALRADEPFVVFLLLSMKTLLPDGNKMPFEQITELLVHSHSMLAGGLVEMS